MSPAGRPEIGAPINIRLGDDLLAAVDAIAEQRGTSRAVLIRTILADQLLTGEWGPDR
jgi:predicted transcriptional regulator